MKRLLLACGLTAASLLAAGPAWPADVQTVPAIDLQVEQNDNFRLDPDSADVSSTTGYIADAVLLFNVATPRGETLIRPRARLQEYPDDDDIERVEAFFDLDSSYRWERSSFQLNAGYSRRDVYNTETLGGEFDPDDPDSPDNPESGAVTTGETRQLLLVRPRFEHRLTERTNLGVSAEYQIAEYSSDDAVTKSDYDYGLAGAYLSWELNPRAGISTRAYASSFETDDGFEKVDAVGAELGYSYHWSETDGIEASVFYEQNDIFEETILGITEERTSDVGGSLTAYRKLEVSNWRLSASRRFAPTGDRGKSTIDQVRLQYDRDLSQRLTFRGAARYESRGGISDTSVDNSARDYARIDLDLKWYVTQTWYVGGGYAYIWQDRESDPSDAANNKFFINFGYQGVKR